MLTSVPVAFNLLSTTTIYVISVSVVTLVFERECQPYCNPYISAFSYVLHWQILMVVLYLLLLDSKMASGASETAIGAVLMVTNLLMMVRNQVLSVVLKLLSLTLTPTPPKSNPDRSGRCSSRHSHSRER